MAFFISIGYISLLFGVQALARIATYVGHLQTMSSALDTAIALMKRKWEACQVLECAIPAGSQQEDPCLVAYRASYNEYRAARDVAQEILLEVAPQLTAEEMSAAEMAGLRTPEQHAADKLFAAKMEEPNRPSQ